MDETPAVEEHPDSNQTTPQPYVVGLRFQKAGKIYHFDASAFPDLRPGDFAIVETSRGQQIGQVVQVVAQPGNGGQPLKPVLRPASARDLMVRHLWQQKEAEALAACQAKVVELKLVGVKVIAAEFSFDGERLSFLYSSEEGEKTELRALRRAVQRLYPQTRIEMHLIGPRDVAKILGGLGACGLECRCCSRFLTDFSPISIKMAKEQGISLTPTEITGMCGRLRCCLIYEYQHYAEMRKRLPKRGKRVVTPQGEGKVVDVQVLREAVVVELEGGIQREYLRHELEPWDEEEASLRLEAERSQAPSTEPETEAEVSFWEEAEAYFREETVGWDGADLTPEEEPPVEEKKLPPRRSPARPSSSARKRKGRSGRKRTAESKPVDETRRKKRKGSERKNQQTG